MPHVFLGHKGAARMAVAAAAALVVMQERFVRLGGGVVSYEGRELAGT